MSSNSTDERGLLELVTDTGAYDWVLQQYDQILSWPGWLRFLLFAVGLVAVPAVSESYRSFAAKRIGSWWRWVKGRPSPKAIALAIREKRRVSRIRKRGRLEASQRRSRAMEILPYLSVPDAEKILREYSFQPSQEFLESKRFGGSSSIVMDWDDQHRYRQIVSAERQSNPIIKEGCALWLLDDYSVIVSREDGTLEIATGDQAKVAQEEFVRSMKEVLG